MISDRYLPPRNVVILNVFLKEVILVIFSILRYLEVNHGKTQWRLIRGMHHNIVLIYRIIPRISGTYDMPGTHFLYKANKFHRPATSRFWSIIRGYLETLGPCGSKEQKFQKMKSFKIFSRFPILKIILLVTLIRNILHT